MAQRTYQCNVCRDPQSGRSSGVVRTPTGMVWQTCPVCQGAGQVTPEPNKEPTWYPITIVVASNSNNTGTIQIQNEDFDLEQILATYTSASLNLTILEGGKPWTKSPTLNINAGSVPVTLITGTAASPFIVYPPYEIKAKEQITITATDSSGAQNTLNFALVGKTKQGQSTSRS